MLKFDIMYHPFIELREFYNAIWPELFKKLSSNLSTLLGTNRIFDF